MSHLARHITVGLVALLCAATSATAAPGEPAPPGKPEDPVAIASSSTTVTLRWGASKGDLDVTHYEVLRDGVPIALTTATEFVESGLRPTVQYCYLVRAHDAAGNHSFFAGACATTPDETPPSAPGDLVAVAVGEHDVRLRWSAASDDVGVAGYEVVRGGHVVAGGPELAAREVGLRAGREYCYEVRAFDRAGNRSTASGRACASTADLTPPTAPAQLVARATSDRTVELSWRESFDDGGVAVSRPP